MKNSLGCGCHLTEYKTRVMHSGTYAAGMRQFTTGEMLHALSRKGLRGAGEERWALAGVDSLRGSRLLKLTLRLKFFFEALDLVLFLLRTGTPAVKSSWLARFQRGRLVKAFLS